MYILKNLIIIFTVLFVSSCGGGSSNSGDLTSGGTLFSDSITIDSNAPTLVFLVGFKNQAISSTATVWANKIFGTNTSDLNHYYNEISSGNFSLTAAIESHGTPNDGVINITMSSNIQTSYSNEQAASIVYDAISIADSVVDYSGFDISPSDGKISRNELQLLFIFAGDEGATTYNDVSKTYTGVWAHASSFVSGRTLDGVVVAQNSNGGGYAVFGEKQISKENSRYNATIGVIAHELGHSLFNLPDLYDINGLSAGIGGFGLMGSGSWGKKIGEEGGETPAHKTGYSKIKSGFISPITLSASTSSVEVYASSSINQNVYKVMVSSPNEYFLIENRDNSGYDEGMGFNGGLLITHIDETISDNRAVSRKLVDVEEANNAELDYSQDNLGDSNNLFKSGNQADFDSASSPNSNSNSGSATNVDISNISATGATMTFDLNL
jgi:M6 family metalloprotease-like protein